MKNYLGYAIFIFFLHSQQVLSDVTLQKGTICRDCQGFTDVQKNKVWDLEDIAAEKNISTIDSIIAYFTLEDNVTNYVLERDLLLAQVNTNDKTLVGPWPLTRTAEDAKKSLQEFYETSAREAPDEEYALQQHNTSTAALGCLWQSPLRYGDIENNGSDELVLYIGSDDTSLEPYNRRLDLIIFSPQSQSVIFSARMAREDNSGLTSEFDIFAQKTPPGHLPQYSSTDTRRVIPATRVYSKIYVGNYDNDTNPDILVWRKRYEPKLIADPTPGFELKQQLYTHYELIEGHYKEQTTDAATIQQWFSTNNLSWQKGYPSQTECVGQTGLIPEMHDPLLNDPDVLK